MEAAVSTESEKVSHPQALSNRERRKARTAAGFVRAAQEIAEEKGYANVTIREVADAAGYNSATIYNYFRDLDELLLFAAYKFQNEYSKDASKRISLDMSWRESLDIMWDCFTTHSFAHVGAFSYIFNNKHSGEAEGMPEKYFTLFPKELEQERITMKSLSRKLSLPERNRFVLEQVYREEGMPLDTLDTVNDLMILAYRGILNEAFNDPESRDHADDYRRRMMDAYDFLMESIKST